MTNDYVFVLHCCLIMENLLTFWHEFYLYLQVTEQVMDEKLGRMVTRVVLPRVVMHSRYHYAVKANFLFNEWNCFVAYENTQSCFKLLISKI